MDHITIGKMDSDFATIVTEWNKWIDKAELLFGKSLDGDQVEDGYSLDFAYEDFRRGLSPADYVARVHRGFQ